MATLLERAVEIAGEARGVRASAEYHRIRNLPLRALDLATVPDLSPLFVIPEHGCRGCELCRDADDRPRVLGLRPIQSAALLEAEASGGLLGPIGVGGGKELLSLLLPEALGAQRAVILTKPRLKTQLLEVDLPRYSRHFRVPQERIAGVVAYSELSTARTADALQQLRPDLIVANECQALRHRASARGWIFNSYMDEHPVPVCNLSGTMSRGSVHDAAPFSERALRTRSPFPKAYGELDDWSRALDSDAKEPLLPGALLDLMGPEVYAEEFARLSEDDKIRVAFDQVGSREIKRDVAQRIFGRRLVGTPGVVASFGEHLGIPLTLTARRPAVPVEVQAALDRLRRLWRIEDEALADGKDVARVAKQLAAGFYYRWDWPGGKKDEEWLAARASWNKSVRHVLRYQRELGRHTPMLVANAARRGELAEEHCAAWATWDRVRARPVPPTVPVWLSDFLVRDIVSWARACSDRARGVIWFQSQALEAALRTTGLPVYAAGDDEILQARQPVICASLAFREGLNIQDRYSRTLVAELPSNGEWWEQLLGRFHRPGQRAPRVDAEAYQHDPALVAALAGALRDARFVAGTQRQEQKLLTATLVGFGELREAEEYWESTAS